MIMLTQVKGLGGVASIVRLSLDGQKDHIHKLWINIVTNKKKAGMSANETNLIWIDRHEINLDPESC